MVVRPTRAPAARCSTAVTTVRRPCAMATSSASRRMPPSNTMSCSTGASKEGIDVGSRLVLKDGASSFEPFVRAPVRPVVQPVPAVVGFLRLGLQGQPLTSSPAAGGTS